MEYSLRWSGDQGLEIYQAQRLQPNEVTLATLWNKWEKVCKPQANKVCASYDLLKSFLQANASKLETYNKANHQFALCEYPPETCNIPTKDFLNATQGPPCQMIV